MTMMGIGDGNNDIDNINRDGMANNEQWGDNNDGNEKMMNGEGMMGGCHHQ